MLSQTASSEPGKWRTKRTPYLQEIMDALSPSSPIEKVVFMKGAQVGGTEAGNNWIGYVMDQAPGPMLVVQPTVEMGKRWSKGRLAPLIESTPCLREKVKDPRARDSGNTVQSKEFPGGMVVITGANSGVGLRSMPVRYLFLDEIDAYPGDASGEGDPVSLAIQRTTTFTRRKVLVVSTPTVQGISRIEKEFEASDKRYYFVPCPVCEGYQVLKWQQVQWEEDPSQAYYRCEHCQGKVFNHQKTSMLEKGEWRATKQASDTKVAGFHLSSLYSPVGWLSFGQAAVHFLHAKTDVHLMKVWVNTILGETWVEKGEAPEWEQLFDQREGYKIGIVPKGGLVLTAGVDVQKNRLEVEIVAWGRDWESWSIDYQVLEGSPTQPAVWKVLEKLLAKMFQSEDGKARSISMMAVDAGYATQEVYRWVRSQPVHRVMAIKGRERAVVPLDTFRRLDVTIDGKKLKKGIRLWPVGVSLLKSELYHALKLKRSKKRVPTGYCHFPEYEAEYFKQLTAEQLVTRTVKGYQKQEWQKIRDRNEALDCRIYARAAGIALGIDRWNAAQWKRLEPVPEGMQEETPIKQRTRVIKSRYLH